MQAPGTPAKKKKTKLVPNASSVSSRWKKKLNINKTRLLQKMGSETSGYSAEFRSNNERCKELVTLYNEAAKVARQLLKEEAAYSVAGLGFAEALVEISSATKSQGLLGPALQKFAQVQTAVENDRDECAKSTSGSIARIERFSKEEIAAARIAKQRFRASRIQYDSANSTLQSLVVKADKPMELFLAQTHYHYAKRKYNRRLLEASNKLSDVIESKEFEILETYVYYMEALHTQAMHSYELLHDLDPFIAELHVYIKKQRENAQEARRLREEAKQARLRLAEQNKYRPLVELLAAPDLAVVSAICHSAGADQATTLDTLVQILDAYKLTLPIIKIGITKEVAETSTEATLFRGNTTATKLMTAFTRLTGRPYLHLILKDIVNDILSKREGYEVNPDKIPEGEDVETNMQRLIQTCQRIMDVVYSTCDKCPPPFRAMANHLRTECVARFPESNYKSVGGFIFLRFLCPAVLSPDTNGLTTGEVSPNARRPLVLISKCIQNLANDVEFGSKESYMLPVNTFITANREPIKNFFDEIATVPPNVMDYTPLQSLEHVNSVEVPNIHHHVVKNLPKIAQTLLSHEHKDAIPLLAHIIAQLED